MSAYLSSQPGSTSQLDLPSLDAIDASLEGLEAYYFRDLSQPRGVSDYDYDEEFWEDIQEGLMIMILMTVLILILMLKMCKRLLKKKNVMDL